jgi:RNA polymerase sigma-70 factor (ECF subfamily)
MVFRTLARLTGEADVEDLAQEVFLRFFRSLSRFRGQAKASTFLYRIAVNVVNDEWRRRERERRAVSLDDHAAGWENRLPGRTPDPGEALDRAQVAALIDQAFQALSLRERMALTLYYQERRSYQEIASILEAPCGTVKALLYRGREKLKLTVRGRLKICKARV